MKILFLDDQKIRHDVFRMQQGHHDITFVTTAASAIAALDQQIYDLVHLDHDLADEHYYELMDGGVTDQDYSPGTGMDVVDHLTRMPIGRRPLSVIVHSFNVVRAPEMVRRLRDAGIAATWKKFGR